MNPTVKKGDRIRLLKMEDDPDPLPVGATGVVQLVLNPHQIHVKWDPPNEHRSLMLLPDADQWEIIEAA